MNKAEATLLAPVEPAAPSRPDGPVAVAHQPVTGSAADSSGAERDVLVQSVTREADGVVSLLLTDPAGAELPGWAPGAHIDLLLTPDLERQYSLCGDPADRSRYRIAILDEPNGRGGSRHVHEHVSAGSQLRIRGPRNNFPLVAAEEYILVAGGIGVTPILTMARELEATARPWKLVYGGRMAASMAFLDELAEYGDKVVVWPQDARGLIDLPALFDRITPGALVYCCGPEVLIDAVENRCAHWPPGSVHVERFRPRAGALDGVNTPFDVRLDYSEITVHVAAGQSIVDAVEAVGIEVLTSCREGTCGTCETPVLGGIPEHRDSLLTAAERAANNTMMICCGRSKTPLLVLDL